MKKMIRLTESELKQIITESCKRVLNEEQPYGQERLRIANFERNWKAAIHFVFDKMGISGKDFKEGNYDKDTFNELWQNYWHEQKQRSGNRQ